MEQQLFHISPQTHYNTHPQVNTGWYDLLNAIILRTVQDYMLDGLAIGGLQRTKGGKEKIKNEAKSFMQSEDFEWICECAGKNYSAIRKFLSSI